MIIAIFVISIFSILFNLFMIGIMSLIFTKIDSMNKIILLLSDHITKRIELEMSLMNSFHQKQGNTNPISDTDLRNLFGEQPPPPGNDKLDFEDDEGDM